MCLLILDIIFHRAEVLNFEKVQFIIFFPSSANVNSFVVLISNSTCTFLAYRKAFGFCILTSYPATLL